MEGINSLQRLPEVNKIDAMSIALQLEKYSEEVAITHEEARTSAQDRRELLNKIAAKLIALAITIRAIGENEELLSEDEFQAALFTIAEGSNAVAAVREVLQEAA